MKKELAISLLAMTAASQSVFAGNWACLSDTGDNSFCAPDPGFTGYCMQTVSGGNCSYVGPYTLTNYPCKSVTFTQGHCVDVG